MKITATISNSINKNDVIVSTESHERKLTIPGKQGGYGSSVNGGELLFLALATCYCNDLYREAAKRKIEVKEVEVAVTGSFGKEGEPATDIQYQVNFDAPSLTESEKEELCLYVDALAEVHNTVRQGIPVTLKM
jgi:organic hydroperoxide reductase OsmC/OhrA